MIITDFLQQLHQPVIQRQRRHDRLIPLASLLELIHVQAPVLILVHHAEDLLDSLLRRVLVFGQFDHGPDLATWLAGLSFRYGSICTILYMASTICSISS